MIRCNHFFLVIFLLLASGCASKSEQITLKNDHETQIVYGHGGKNGRFTVFVSEQMADELESGNFSLPEGVKLTRALYYDPEFEERHRAAGLHRWYYAECDSLPRTKAVGTLSQLEGLMYMEETPTPAPDEVVPFNDPDIFFQWHINNPGTIVGGAKAHCDINVLPVWERFTGGKSEVIVGVVDTGVQADHPDLEGVVLPAGSNGSRSFLNSKFLTPYNITPQRHGTHVAGIIAAINNNGVGGCGIAGGLEGNGGVRIIDCQAIATEDGDGGNTYSAIVWAADHGAVLVNNSWNYVYDSEDLVPSTTPSDISMAIDYFIEKAGTDGHGNQTGPMKGGLVFFSAGNKSWMRSQPSMSEKVIAVGATGPAGESSSYTNYGDWVDICAPGGNYNPYGSYNALIYSTVSGGGYAQMQGTSQASPMVCGVAALLVSHFGGPGFTNEDLKAMLLGGADREDSHARKIGPSLDAFESFVYKDRQMDPVKDITIVDNGTSATLKWKVGTCQDGNFYAYKVLLSESESALQGVNPFSIPSGVRSTTVSATATGNTLAATFGDLSSNKTYYTTIIGYTRSHQYAKGNSIVCFKLNGAPVLYRKDGNAVELRHNEKCRLSILCSDPDGDELTLTVDTGSPACTWSYSDGTILLDIDASSLAPGYYFVKIKADDGKAATNLELRYTVLANEGVKLVKLIQDQVFDAGVNFAIPLEGYFSDPDGDAIIYQAACSDPEVRCTIVGSVLTLFSPGFSASTLTIEASDGDSAPRVAQLRIRAVDDPSGICVASTVVSDKLLLSCSKAGEANVTIYGSTGRKLYSRNIYQTPFEPGAVNMSDYPSGRYTVVVKFDGMTRKIIIAKI